MSNNIAIRIQGAFMLLRKKLPALLATLFLLIALAGCQNGCSEESMSAEEVYQELEDVECGECSK
jgi:hypothetical protein